MKQRLTAICFAEQVGAQVSLSTDEVLDAEAVSQAQVDAVAQVAAFMTEHRVVRKGDLDITWACRVAVTGYRTPDEADLGEFRDAVAAQDKIDHFGKPAAVEFAFEIEVPHRD